MIRGGTLVESISASGLSLHNCCRNFEFVGDHGYIMTVFEYRLSLVDRCKELRCKSATTRPTRGFVKIIHHEAFDNLVGDGVADSRVKHVQVAGLRDFRSALHSPQVNARTVIDGLHKLSNAGIRRNGGEMPPNAAPTDTDLRPSSSAKICWIWQY